MEFCFAQVTVGLALQATTMVSRWRVQRPSHHLEWDGCGGAIWIWQAVFSEGVDVVFCISYSDMILDIAVEITTTAAWLSRRDDSQVEASS